MKQQMETIKRYFKRFSKKEDRKNRDSSASSDKNAILIGLNYPGTRYALKGCVNDVKNGDKFLKDHRYKTKVLTDKDVSQKYNILENLSELGKSKEKRLFFHYSGHGTQTLDKNGDESDGLDEAIFSSNGLIIVDDQINETLTHFPVDKTVILLFDCCHSGSIADLPYTLTPVGYLTEKVVKNVNTKVICISGCKDPQTSADITQGGISYGALSQTLYSLLRKNKKRTWRQFYTELLYEMQRKGYQQIPLISASNPSIFDEEIQI